MPLNYTSQLKAFKQELHRDLCYDIGLSTKIQGYRDLTGIYVFIQDQEIRRTEYLTTETSTLMQVQTLDLHY